MIKNTEQYVALNWYESYCPEDGRLVSVQINTRGESHDIGGICFECQTYVARCPYCGSELFIPYLEQVNDAIRKIEFYKAKAC